MYSDGWSFFFLHCHITPIGGSNITVEDPTRSERPVDILMMGGPDRSISDTLRSWECTTRSKVRQPMCWPEATSTSVRLASTSCSTRRHSSPLSFRSETTNNEPPLMTTEHNHLYQLCFHELPFDNCSSSQQPNAYTEKGRTVVVYFDVGWFKIMVHILFRKGFKWFAHDKTFCLSIHGKTKKIRNVDRYKYRTSWFSGIVVSLHYECCRFESRVCPLFHWIPTLSCRLVCILCDS